MRRKLGYVGGDMGFAGGQLGERKLEATVGFGV